jgi:hypothetical protein
MRVLMIDYHCPPIGGAIPRSLRFAPGPADAGARAADAAGVFSAAVRSLLPEPDRRARLSARG